MMIFDWQLSDFIFELALGRYVAVVAFVDIRLKTFQRSNFLYDVLCTQSRSFNLNFEAEALTF